jgi:uncharacterized integral membrane protein
MRVIVWLLRGFVFFVLFAFALNNQQTVVVHWFFGIDWSAPLVIVVLIAFAIGAGLGVMAMLPAWWRLRRRASSLGAPTASPVPAPPAARSSTPSGFGTEAPRDVW